MANQRILSLIDGIATGAAALVSSAGSADAGKLVATGDNGRLDESLMPEGIGANITPAVASEAIGAGKFINFHSVGGVLNIRLADNSNNRPANGFVKEAVANAATGQVYQLDTTNSNLSGLTPGAKYYLGLAGGVVAVALGAQNDNNFGNISQYIGTAKSATELVTTDDTIFII